MKKQGGIQGEIVERSNDGAVEILLVVNQSIDSIETRMEFSC